MAYLRLTINHPLLGTRRYVMRSIDFSTDNLGVQAEELSSRSDIPV